MGYIILKFMIVIILHEDFRKGELNWSRKSFLNYVYIRLILRNVGSK